MPDHEEAVREAEWTYNEWRDYLADVVPFQFVDEFESAIRASERAKYAALVEAVKVYVDTFRTKAFEDMWDALAALQSKEGTN